MTVYTKEYSSDFWPAMPVVDIVIRPELDVDGLEVEAIVDSGADSTMLPLAMLEQFQLVPARTAWMTGVNGHRTAVSLYWVFIGIGKNRPIYAEVIGTQRNELILGRNVLNQFAVLLNGPAQFIEIS